MTLPNSGYRPTATPGLYEIEVGGGWLPIPATEEELQGQGYQLRQPEPAAAPASTFNAFTGSSYEPLAPPPPPEAPVAGMGGAGGASSGPSGAMGAGSSAAAPPVRPLPPQPAAAPPPRAPAVPPQAARAAPSRPAAKPKPAAVNPDDPNGIGAAWNAAQGAEDPISELDERAADASINRKALAQERTDLIAGQASSRAQMLAESVEAEREAIARQRQRDAQIAADYEERQQAIDREREEVRALKVNPNQYFEDQEAAATMFSAIALMAGGVRAGIRGGDNQAMRMLEGAIDRNIDAQKANIELRRQGLTDRETELERLMKLYGTPQAAEAELRDRHRLMIQTYAEQQASEAQSQEAMLNLREAFAGWDAEREQQQAQLAAALHQDAVDKALRAEVSRRTPYAALLQQDDVRGLGLQLAKDDLKPKGGPGVDSKLEAEIKALGAARQAAGLNEGSAEAGNLHDLISQVPEGGEIPSDITRGALNKAARGAVDWVGGYGTAADMFDSDAEQAAAAKLARAHSALISKLSGANVPPQEFDRLKAGIYATSSRDGLQAMSAEIDRAQQRKEAGVRAGFSSEANALYDARKQAREPARRQKSMRAE